MSDRRQSLLFSATMPKTLADFAQAGLQSPQLIRLDTETRISPELKLAFFTVRCGEVGEGVEGVEDGWGGMHLRGEGPRACFGCWQWSQWHT